MAALNLETCFRDVAADFVQLATKLSQGKRVVIGTTNPADVADCYLAKFGLNLLRNHQDTWWTFAGTHYVEVPEGDLRATLTSYVEGLYDKQVVSIREQIPGYDKQVVPRAVTGGFVSDVLAALRAKTLVPSSVTMPSWLGEGHQGTYISFANGLVAVTDLLAGNPTVEPHGPWWFSANTLPFNYEPQATCPRWEAFVSEVLEADAQRIALLREWFGYCMIPDTSMQTFLMMEGAGANGKSVIVNVLSGLLGNENVSSVPIEAFGARFSLSATVGKLLNVCSEASKLTPQIEGMIKQYVGGDLLTVDRKHISPLQFRPTARLLITTNNRPSFADQSDGMWRRLITLPFKVQIPAERQVKNLDQQLLGTEAPGIFNWAMEGLRSLKAQGAFTVPEISREALKQYREDDDPLTAFIRFSFIQQDHTTPCAEAYRAYVDWANTTGERPMSSAAFGRQLRRVFPTVTRGSGRTKASKVVECYKGLKLVNWEPMTLM